MKDYDVVQNQFFWGNILLVIFSFFTIQIELGNHNIINTEYQVYQVIASERSAYDVK